MTDSDKELLASYGSAYNAAKASGDTAGMTDAHNRAEALRASYGYSGGVTGGEYKSLLAPSESGYLDAMLEAQRQSDIASLQSAYDSNVLSLDAKSAKLKDAYDDARNKAYSQSETSRAGWNEYAAGSGLNSGAGGQASLAYSNALQSSMTGLNKSQASAEADIALQKAQLDIKYKDAIAKAISDGELERANQLYKLAQTRADTMAGIGDYSGYSQFGYTQAQIDALKAAYEEARGA